MFELKITFISQSDILCGVMVDTGQVEVSESKWLDFTRLRIGLIFLTFDLTWLKQ